MRSSLLLFLSVISFSSQAQRVNASIQLDSSDYRIGDPIALKLNVDHPYGVVVEWLQSIPLSGNFEKISESSIDSILQKSFLTEMRTITITTFDTGRMSTPEITVWFRDKDGTLDHIPTNEVIINVSLVNADLKKSFHPIAPPIQLTTWFRPVYLVVAGVLLLLILFFVYRGVMKRKRKRAEELAYRASLKPEETILMRLNDLEESLLQKRISVEKFFVRLTILLREHIQKEFGFPAMEHTSPEILRYVKVHLEDPDLMTIISEIFQLADLVKFAKLHPSSEENENVMKAAIDFVKRTSASAIQTVPDAT